MANGKNLLTLSPSNNLTIQNKKTMEIQRYKVEDKDLALLNKLYVYLNYNPSFYGNVELNVDAQYAVPKIEEIVDIENYYSSNHKVLRNTCFSDNQIKFMDVAEKVGYDVYFKFNNYGAFEPYILSTMVDEKLKKFSLSSYSENQDEVFFRFEKRELESPMRGMHNGRWVDYFYFIAVQ
jgi:hypothetical protein